MEIFTMVIGIAYIILEIKQKNFMWIVGMVSSAATIYMFLTKNLYASAGLNVYYLVISVIGLIQWRKDSARLKSAVSAEASAPEGTEPVTGPVKDDVHLSHMSLKVFLWSVVVSIAGTVLLILVLRLLGDPMSDLDAAVAIVSAVATYWLSRSYIQHWYVWIFANILTFVMCLSQELYWMSALYIGYSVSAVIGLLYWKRKGCYLD